MKRSLSNQDEEPDRGVNENDKIAQKQAGESWKREKISNPISWDCLPPTLEHEIRTYFIDLRIGSLSLREERGRTSRSMLAVNKLKVQHNNSSLFGPGLKYRRFSLLCFVCRMRTWGCEDFVNISWFYRKFLEIDSVEARADTLIHHGEARIAEKRTHISGVLCCQWTKAEKLNFDIMK